MKISSFHVRDAGPNEIPVVVSIPHSGIYVPEAMRTDFASEDIRALPMTDWYLHYLLDFLPAMGITTIYGTYSRFVADVNRPPPAARGSATSDGFVPLHTFWGEPVFQEPPTPAEIDQRRDLVYAPYHARLSELLQSRITRYGGVALVDVHSLHPRPQPGRELPHADVYVGDAAGTANSGWLTRVFEHGFRNATLRVRRNQPFRGGYITAHYGAMPRVAAVHLELRQGLYLEEQQPERMPTHARFNAFKSTMSDVFTGLVSEVRRRGSVSK